MANVLRDQKQNKNREWWLEEDGGCIKLMCSTDNSDMKDFGWTVLRINECGDLELYRDIQKDGLKPKLYIDSDGYMKVGSV